jgi:signal transduction histidine kinase
VKLIPAGSSLQLPARTNSLQIAYTAPALTIPERARFRYRLDGPDREWQQAGTRRETFYANLGPGNYKFHVIAGNSDGEWYKTETVLSFSIAPAYYQTWWFQMTYILLAATALWLFYRYRLTREAALIRQQIGARIEERERIARELHDTLLQSFQGLMLRFQAVNDILPEGKAKDQLEQTLQRGDQAIAEGRNAVYDLRSSTLATSNLVEAVQSLGPEVAKSDSPPFRLVVEGDPKDLHPIIRDEIYHIAREALRNAFIHAQARNIETEIIYGERDLRLRIRDDGKGIPAEVLKEGRHGHFGLRGMRERAQQIGGKLDIWSQQGAGTEIELRVATECRSSAGFSLRSLFRKSAG